MKHSLKKLVTLTCFSILLGPQILLPQQPANSQANLSFLGASGCPAGTREGPSNLVVNGNFADLPGTAGVNNANGRLLPNNPARFTSTLPYRGDDLYPNDAGTIGRNALGGLSIQVGETDASYDAVVRGIPFPGDPANSVLPSNTYLYSNPNASADTPLTPSSAFPPVGPREPIVWSQVITGLSPNSSYNFTGYFFNLLRTDAPANLEPPQIVLLAGPPGGPDSAFVPTLEAIRIVPRQQWVRVQGAFNVGNLTSLELRVVDRANTIEGDDFGMTAVGFRQCIPIPISNAPTENQRFRLVKRITGVTRNGAPVAGVNFGEVVNDPNDTNDDAPGWAQFPPVGVLNVGATNPLQSGDEVTYTVYFLSDGDIPTRSVNICDPIPNTTTYVPLSSQIQRPSTALSAGGAFFPPLTPLPADNSCPSQTNTNGSVLYDVGDVSNAPGNNFGLVRFRVRID